MLLFYPTLSEETLSVRHSGLRNTTLLPALPEPAPGEIVLVIDGEKLPQPLQEQEGAVHAEFVPPHAVLNLNPYQPPRAVTAAGGYVLRRNGTIRDEASDPLVLLIFRRGVWDLPKGKLDEGETVEECALREVREEVGIRELRLLGEAGVTRHGYAERDCYRIKTTHWYFMHTPEADFTPQAEEDIEQVAWMPWSQAEQTLGFDSLRKHMLEAGPAARAAAATLSPSNEPR